MNTTDNHDCAKFKELHREGYEYRDEGGEKVRYTVYTNVCSKCGRVLGGTIKVRE
ncbi:hypothetical protein CCP3SC15_1540009 [Gammaproteobacteria bacterium]